MVRTVSLNVRGNGTPAVSVRGGVEAPRTLGGYTDGIREDSLVVEDILAPVHEGIDVRGRGKLRRAFVAHAIFPEVFVSRNIKVQSS